MMDALTREAVERMLIAGFSADELHAAIDRGVNWIEAHPRAGAQSDLTAMLASEGA